VLVVHDEMMAQVNNGKTMSWVWQGEQPPLKKKGAGYRLLVIQGRVGSGQSIFLVLDHDLTDFFFLLIVSTDNQTMVNPTSNPGCRPAGCRLVVTSLNRSQPYPRQPSNNSHQPSPTLKQLSPTLANPCQPSNNSHQPSNNPRQPLPTLNNPCQPSTTLANPQQPLPTLNNPCQPSLTTLDNP
jgi:hypothetical protein